MNECKHDIKKTNKQQAISRLDSRTLRAVNVAAATAVTVFPQYS